MIILEGPDGSGKSTLVQQLNAQGYPLHPRHADWDGPTVPLYNWMDSVLDNPSVKLRGLVFDRFPLFSEPIYGGIMRGELEIPFDNRYIMQSAYRRLAIHNPALIICLPPRQVVRENVTQPGQLQMAGVDRLTDVIYQAYYMLSVHLDMIPGLRPYLYDYTARLYPTSVNTVLDYIVRRESQ